MINSVSNGIPEDEKENQKNIIEPMDSEGADEPANDTIPVFQAGESEHLEKETGTKADDVQVIATGGLNSMLSPITDIFDHTDKNLTLDGMIRIYNFIRGACC